jgi:AcrR family transcriptional regulator
MAGALQLGLRERKKLDTRRALSDAALELAFERGLKNITREDIADRAGVSLRTFSNYFTGKYEALAYRQTERIRRSLAAFRERPSAEPLWQAITAAVLEPLVSEGADDLLPTPQQLAEVRKLVLATEARAAISKDVFAGWVSEIAERTGTDPVHDLYPRLVAAVVRAVVEAAMDTYVVADPPVSITSVLRRGLADVAAGLPEGGQHE